MKHLESVAEFFKAFSETNRITILEALQNGRLNVTSVVENTGLSQALVSKHLKLLNTAGIIRREPQGNLVFYQVVDKDIFKLMSKAKNIIHSINQNQLNKMKFKI